MGPNNKCHVLCSLHAYLYKRSEGKKVQKDNPSGQCEWSVVSSVCVVLGEDGGKNQLYIGSSLFSVCVCARAPVSLILHILLLLLLPIIVASHTSVRRGTKT